MERSFAKWWDMNASSGNTQARQLTELYRALRRSRQLLPTLDETPVETTRWEKSALRLRSSQDSAEDASYSQGSSSFEKHYELNAVAQSLDPLRLLEQLEQLQKALFLCAALGNPFVSYASTLPIRVFSVPQCTREVGPVQRDTPDSPAGLAVLHQEQEKRKRVLGWRRTHNDPFAGEWEQILSWLVANPERSSGDIFRELQRRSPGRYQPLQIHTREPRDAQDPGPSGTETREEQWQEEVIPRTILLANFREMLCQLTLVALK